MKMTKAESREHGYSGMGLEGATGKEQVGTYWRDRAIVYLSWGGGYTGVYICQNPPNQALKIMHFII